MLAGGDASYSYSGHWEQDATASRPTSLLNGLRSALVCSAWIRLISWLKGVQALV